MRGTALEIQENTGIQEKRGALTASNTCTCPDIMANLKKNPENDALHKDIDMSIPFYNSVCGFCSFIGCIIFLLL